MIIILNAKAGEQAVNRVIHHIESEGLKVDVSRGVESITIGIVGDVRKLDEGQLRMMDGVDKVMAVSESYKKANRKFHPDNTVIDVHGVKIGGKEICVMAGPCSVESKEQINAVAAAVKKSGAQILRGGAYKPRSSPYAFQGLQEEGMDLMKDASRTSGLPMVTEITNPRTIERFEKEVDIIQIGARNMQNFELLKEVGELDKPILLKRGLSSTIEEWLMSAEYIMSRGNKKVILCERGIRTFENFTRNTLDLSAVVAVKKLSHLPVIVDPSHATGHNWMVESLAMAAVVAGADGLIIEVHNDPANALCDGPQSITPEEFDDVMVKLRAIAPIVGRTL